MITPEFKDFDSEGKILQFVIQVPAVSSKAEGQAIKDIFDQNPETEGVVITENNHPVGLIMRTMFYQKMGTMYGHSLYMKRPVSILMETDMMSADATDNVSKVGILAMSREQNKLYDYVIVYKNKAYAGVISIRLFLVELSKINDAQINVLKHQQKELLTAHEQEVVLRKDLEYKSDAVRNLFDHAEQGFLSFGSDLTVKNEYSYKCIEIFNQNIGGFHYIDLISRYFDADKKSVFETAFDSFFKNNSMVTDNVYLMLLPAECEINGKNIRFDYKRIESNGKKSVMVILSDVTELISMEKAMEEDKNKQRLLIKAFTCQAQIKQMIEEFTDLFSGGYKLMFIKNNFEESLNEFFRAVHTYKGDFAQYGFMTASAHIHHFEEELLQLFERTDKLTNLDVERIMSEADPKNILEADLSAITEVLGESYFGESEIITIPKYKLEQMKEQFASEQIPTDKNTLMKMIDNLKYKNIKIYLEQYQDYLKYLCERLMKYMPTYIIEGDDVEIDPDQYSDALKSLVHIFRNSMDHGIETNEERLEYGKPERGIIHCQIQKYLDENRFELRISDDGRGIDLHKLKIKALDNNIRSADDLNLMDDSEAAKLIFADHLSTKDNADALSGRGIGMGAVKEACMKLGGTIEIETKPGEGTIFILSFPYSV